MNIFRRIIVQSEYIYFITSSYLITGLLFISLFLYFKINLIRKKNTLEKLKQKFSQIDIQ
ncbi:MAG: hypothetical protein ACI9JG_000842 [Alphaproteobacteria bacterium]|jgi:hypothetical protein|tara:strand:+ start:8073 stop:8252 length:180 start_codon:yes stop_codon:yes gene_type:complete